MATHDYVIANQSGAAFRTDLNNALAAIVSNNSNSSAPSTTYAYQWWADTNTGILKIRNSSNNAWVELLQLDDTLTLEDGSASTPGLAFRDDLNTGIFSSAADTFNVATAGVERMELGATTIFNEDGADVDFRIESDTGTHAFFLQASDGSIGINTSSPNQLLEVANSSGGATISISTDEQAGSTSSKKYNNLDFTGYNNTVMARIQSWDESSSTGHGYLTFFTNKSGVGFTEKVRIDPDGNMMIGLTSTSNKFHVEGTTTGSRFGVDVSSSGITALAVTNESNADIEFVIYDGRSSIGSSVNIPIAFHTNSKTNEAMRITTDRRLLVGHTSSQGVAGGNSKIQVQSNDSTGRISIVQHRNEASGAPFLSLGKTRATSTNNSTLVVNGDTLGTIAFAGGDGTDIHSVAAQIVCQVDDTAAANDMPGRLVFFTTPDGSDTPAEVMRMLHAGHIVGGGMTGLTTATDKSGFTISKQSDHGRFNLHAQGTAGTALMQAFYHGGVHVGSINVTSSSVLYQSHSDYRLKENVTAISDGITRLKTLKPYRFNFKSEPDKTVDGFFAHEVTAVPEAITGIKDETFSEDDESRGVKAGDAKYQAIDQSKLVPLLVAAVQELITKVETLEAA